MKAKPGLQNMRQKTLDPMIGIKPRPGIFEHPAILWEPVCQNIGLATNTTTVTPQRYLALLPPAFTKLIPLQKRGNIFDHQATIHFKTNFL